MNTADGRKGFDKHMKRKSYLWPKYSTLPFRLIFTAVNLHCARHRPKYDSAEKCHIACGPSCCGCSEYGGGSSTPPGAVGSVGLKSSAVPGVLTGAEPDGSRSPRQLGPTTGFKKTLFRIHAYLHAAWHGQIAYHADKSMWIQ